MLLFLFLTVCNRYVLDRILSGEATETVVEQIHDYLVTIGEDVRAGKVKLDEFIVFKVHCDICFRDVPRTDSVSSGWVRTRRIILMRRASRTSRSLCG